MSRPYSVYPNNYDGNNQLPLAIDNVTPINAEVVNRLIDAVQAIEAELGLKPSGTYATVRARLDDLIAGSGGGTNVITVSVSPFSDGGPIIQTKTSKVPFPVNGILEKIRLVTTTGINSSVMSQANIYIGTFSSYDKYYTIPDFSGSSPVGLAMPGDMIDIHINEAVNQGDFLAISWINNGANITGDLIAYLTYNIPQG